MGCDNAGTISFTQNESINRRNKHVNVKYYYVRDAIKRGIVSLTHCPTTSMPADILAKALGRILFQKFVELLGLAVATSGKSMWPRGSVVILRPHADTHATHWHGWHVLKQTYSAHRAEHLWFLKCIRVIFVHDCTLQDLWSMFSFQRVHVWNLYTVALYSTFWAYFIFSDWHVYDLDTWPHYTVGRVQYACSLTDEV